MASYWNEDAASDASDDGLSSAEVRWTWTIITFCVRCLFKVSKTEEIVLWMGFPQLLVAGQARQLFPTYTTFCFLEPHSQREYLLALILQFPTAHPWDLLKFLTREPINSSGPQPYLALRLLHVTISPSKHYWRLAKWIWPQYFQIHRLWM